MTYLVLDEAFWIQVGIAALLALSVYLPMTTGALSIPQAGLAAIGAYTAVVAFRLGMEFWQAAVLAVVVGTLVGLGLTLCVSRLSLFGLAIVTLGFGEIVRAVFVNWDLVGGALGIVGIPLRTTVWPVYVPLAAIVLVVARLEAGPLGRSLAMVRTDLTTAEAVGVNTKLIRHGAILASAPIAAYAGVMQAFFGGFLDPSTFGLDVIVTTATAVVLGGMTSVWGALAGALFINLMPQVFRDLLRWRIVAYGIVMILALALRPEGLISRSLVMWMRSSFSAALERIVGRTGSRSKGEVHSP